MNALRMTAPELRARLDGLRGDGFVFDAGESRTWTDGVIDLIVEPLMGEDDASAVAPDGVRHQVTVYGGQFPPPPAVRDLQWSLDGTDWYTTDRRGQFRTPPLAPGAHRLELTPAVAARPSHPASATLTFPTIRIAGRMEHAVAAATPGADPTRPVQPADAPESATLRFDTKANARILEVRVRDFPAAGGLCRFELHSPDGIARFRGFVGLLRVGAEGYGRVILEDFDPAVRDCGDLLFEVTGCREEELTADDAAALDRSACANLPAARSVFDRALGRIRG